MNGKREQIIRKSIDIILAGQDSTGSFPASTEFPGFHYSWLRDGTFIAYGMLVSGHPESMKKFLQWENRAISPLEHIVEKVEERVSRGEKLKSREILPARYTMEGKIEEKKKKGYFFATVFTNVYATEEGTDTGGEWNLFQVDSYGIWMWGLAQYLEKTGDLALLEECKKAVELSVRYLKCTWNMKCYDSWEEYGAYQHPSTLGCVAGGLIAINKFLKHRDIDELIEKIKEKILSLQLPDGTLPKYAGTTSTDSSLIWIGQPYKVFPVDHPLVQKTAARVREKLLVNGGVKRYLEDVYYGGGKWIVQTCWLGWFDVLAGNLDEAKQLLEWSEEHSTENLLFPEQVLEDLNFPEHADVWKKNNWANSPTPLLWAHAMYLILVDALGLSKLDKLVQKAGSAS
jgi:GH15 family glucan-1,4-alpha-glucosidase